MITYTVYEKNPDTRVHQAHPAAAAASMKRAGKLAIRAQAALESVTNNMP